MANVGERKEALLSAFEKTFGTKAQVTVKGPGRVDLMGSHTDYNEGFVLPVAINMEVIAAGRLTGGDTIKIYSKNFDSVSEFPVNEISYDSKNKWSNYIRGVLKFIAEAGVELKGAEMAVDGDVPIGSGLSSSAALEMATGVLFRELLGFNIDGPQLALIGQAAENKFVGVNTGIMDQFISGLGKKDHALFLDCRTLDYELVPLKTDDIKLVVCDTMKRRGLVDSEYNTRRAQCEEAAKLLGVKALRDVSIEEFERRKDELPEVVRKRAKHIVYENDRGLGCREALKAGDLARFTRLMNESTDSSRDYYEVSCKELDVMAESARSFPGCLSARPAGAGFGGCIVAAVEDKAVEGFLEHTAESYRKKIGQEPSLYVCTAEDGAGPIEG